MKHVTITYHMTKPGEEAESCIRLPMLPEIAANVVRGNITEALETLLNALAGLQGYETAWFVGAEEPE